MKTRLGYRKRIKHFDQPGACRELTFSCFDGLPLLSNDDRCAQLSALINRAMDRYHYDLIAFVYMPNHVHLLVLPQSGAAGVDKLLWAVKRPFSFRIKQQLLEDGDPLLSRLTVVQRPGVFAFRFWQEGPGYDRNLSEAKTIEASIDYIHRNPVRRDLCRQAIDWRWSSARQYHAPSFQRDEALPFVKGLPAGYLDSLS